MSTHTLSEARPRGGDIRRTLARAARLLCTERGVVWAALGVVALHVVDENYLQREPGTSAGDHLVSGLVPLAILALGAWAYPRVRAGARAMLAATFGALGIATGLPGVYYLSHDAAQGDHWTGLLAIAAGVVLILSAPVTLWRHRSHDESRLAPLSPPRRRRPSGSRSSRRSCSSSSCSRSATSTCTRTAAASSRTPSWASATRRFVSPRATASSSPATTSRRRTVPQSCSTRAQAPRARPACSCATATACCSSTRAARAGARATSAGGPASTT